jgi:hypothetical protein
VARFFFQERLKLADAGLAEVNDVHGPVASSATPVARDHDSWQMRVNEEREVEEVEERMEIEEVKETKGVEKIKERIC